MEDSSEEDDSEEGTWERGDSKSGNSALIGMQSKQLTVAAHMDWVMLAMTFVISVAAAILAGLLPTWRACQVTPAIQLKSQ